MVIKANENEVFNMYFGIIEDLRYEMDEQKKRTCYILNEMAYFTDYIAKQKK